MMRLLAGLIVVCFIYSSLVVIAGGILYTVDNPLGKPFLVVGLMFFLPSAYMTFKIIEYDNRDED